MTAKHTAKTTTPDTTPEIAQAVDKAVETPAEAVTEAISESWVVRVDADRPHLVSIGQVGWVGPAQITCLRTKLGELATLLTAMEG